MEIKQPAPERGFTTFSGEEFRAAERSERQERTPEPEAPAVIRKPVPEPAPSMSSGEKFTPQNNEPEPEWVSKLEKNSADNEQTPAQTKPKVIRKNAAAISAYGKIAGTPLSKADSGFEAVSRPEESTAEPLPEKPAAEEQSEEIDPFFGLESIFDVLEQSENDMSMPTGYGFMEEAENTSRQTKSAEKAEKADHADREDAPKKAAHERRQSEHPAKRNPRSAEKRNSAQESRLEQNADEIPSGIWTEDRHLFKQENADQTTHEELNMLKEKKRGRSSKTQRLFEAIMREPDDNPNFRKK